MADPAEDVLASYVAYRIIRAFVTFWCRFFTGAPIDGRPRTRSDFLHGSQESLNVSRRASRWEKHPGYVRALWRTFWLITIPIVIFDLITNRGPTLLLLLCAAVAIVGYKAAHIEHWFKTRRVRREVINPIAAALGHVVGQPNAIQPADWVHLQRNGTVRVDLPEHFAPTPEVMETVGQITDAKLGGNFETTYHVAGSEPIVVLEHAPPPPADVPWSTVIGLVNGAPVGQPLIGLGSRGPAFLDFRGETPHVYASVPNGLGKTTFGRTIGCQVLHHGGRLIIIDSVKKGASHSWADGLPGVKYCRTPEETHWALLRLQDEIASRWDAPDPEGLPQLLTIVEDALGTADQLQVVWRSQLGKGSGLMRSPAVMALQEVFTAGRQCNANVGLFANKATAAAFGGSNGAAARENATPILHSMCSEATWELLTTITKPPPQEKIPGRMWLVDGGVARPVQVANPTDAEARAWATSGVPQPPAPPEVDELPGWLSESPSAVA